MPTITRSPPPAAQLTAFAFPPLPKLSPRNSPHLSLSQRINRVSLFFHLTNHAAPRRYINITKDVHVLFTLNLFFSSELEPEFCNRFILFPSFHRHNHRHSHHHNSDKVAGFIRHLTIRRLSRKSYPNHQHLPRNFHLAF